MSAVVAETPLRGLAERTFDHPIVSVFFDLDPSSFGRPDERASETHSLLDRAHAELREMESLDHADRVALEQDLRRVRDYLTGELDAAGACGVAVYCSSRAGLFETVRLTASVGSEVMIDSTIRLEPLLPAPEPAKVCVALISRRDAHLLTRTNAGTMRVLDIEDEVHGQHRKGGRSETNYERSIEADVDAHMRRAADALYRIWKSESFDRLVLGGPHEDLSRFASKLHSDLVGLLDRTELRLESRTISPARINEALEPVRAQWRAAARREAVNGLLNHLGGRAGATAGVTATLAALGERRVATLLLAPEVDMPGSYCPTCDQLYEESAANCPADGTALGPLQSLRAAMIRCAVLQDAHVILLTDSGDETDPDLQPVSRRPEIEAFGGVGALLRY